MRIVLFIGGLSGGGAERVVCNLADFLRKSGQDVVLLTISNAPSSYHYDESIERISLLKKKKKLRFLNLVSIVWRYLCYLKKNKNIVVVSFLPATIILSLVFRRRIKGKLIVAERANPANYSKSVQYLLRRFVKRADGIVFQTDRVKTWYDGIRGKALFVIIPNAVNKDWRAKERSINKQDVIVTAGRLTKQKNFALLIRAFYLVAPKFPSISLSIYGEGEEKSNLGRLIVSLGLESRIHIFDYTNRLPDVFSESRLFVLSSDYEGIPNALLEAMSVGLPCISTKCEGGGAELLVKDMYNGVLVPRGDEGALASAIEALLQDERLAETLGNHAKEVSQMFSAETIYSQWLAFIHLVFED